MRSFWTLVLQKLVPHMLESPFTSQSKQATFLPPPLIPAESWVPWADTGRRATGKSYEVLLLRAPRS